MTLIQERSTPEEFSAEAAPPRRRRVPAVIAAVLTTVAVSALAVAVTGQHGHRGDGAAPTAAASYTFVAFQGSCTPRPSATIGNGASRQWFDASGNRVTLDPSNGAVIQVPMNLGTATLTGAQFRQLPTDPAALRSALTSLVQPIGDGLQHLSPSAQLLYMIGVIATRPVDASLRTAALALGRTIDGVQVTDGAAGTELVLADPGGSRVDVTIDPQTGMLRTGTVVTVPDGDPNGASTCVTDVVTTGTAPAIAPN